MPRMLQLLAATVLTIACSGCSKPTVPPAEKKPEPQATALRDAVQAPIDRAKAVEGVQKAADDARRAEIDAAQ